MKEVLTKVFKDLPGSSNAVTAIIDSTSKPSAAQLAAVRGKSIQLSGFEVCRKVAVNFVKSPTDEVQVAIYTENSQTRVSILYESKLWKHFVCFAQRRWNDDDGGGGPTEFEARKRMSAGLDLHLAAKQRDYTARLMREWTFTNCPGIPPLAASIPVSKIYNRFITIARF